MRGSREIGQKEGFPLPKGAKISKATYRFFNKMLQGIYDPKFKIFG